MAYNVYLTTLIISVLISAVLAVFFWRRHPAPGAKAMTGMMAAVFTVSMGYIVEVLTSTLAGRQIANDIEYIGITTGPVFWLIFTARYFRYDNWVLRRSYILTIIPIITIGLVWTNDFHGFMWHDAHLQTYGEFLVQIKTYSVWFWVHSLYSYSLVLLGITIATRKLFHPQHLYRNQAMLILFAAIFPLIWNVIYVLRAAPTYHVDLTPAAFMVSGLVIALGLFRFHILRIVPIARDVVVENISDGVMVLDDHERFLDLNQAAQEIIGSSAAKLIGNPSDVLWATQPELEGHFRSKDKLTTEIYLVKAKRGYYELNIVPLHDRQHVLIGRVVILHDLTRQKEFEEELRTLSHQVVHLQEEERAAISRELHDDIGQMLAYLTLQLERTRRLNPELAAGALQEMKASLAETISQVRDISHRLRPPMLESGLLPALEELTRKLASKANITFDLNCTAIPAVSGELNLAVYRIVQEALTNIIRHSRANKVKITLFQKDGQINLEVKDNGVGFDVSRATRTAGLIGMKERVRSLGGRLVIQSAPGSGTIITAILPVAKSESENESKE